MLKTTGLSDLALTELGTDEVVGSDGRADEMVVDSSKLSKSRKSRQKLKNLKGLKSRKCHQLGGTKLPGLRH